MMHLAPRLSITLLAVLLAMPAKSGPNWEAIEAARAEKQQAKQEAEQIEKQRRSTRERLEQVCGRLKDSDKELEALCQEMLALYQECGITD